MTRRKGRSGPGAALFGFGTDGDITPGQVRDNPLLRECPSCHARIADPCTAPSHGGRRRLTGYHGARTQPEGETTNA